VCGLLRWIQTYVTITAEAVSFAHLNDVTWDDLGRRISRTGSDPYLVFDLPAHAVPIRTISFQFTGDYVPTEGQFYILQSSGEEPNIKIGPTVHPDIRTSADVLFVNATLDDATGLRLDLPDFLPRSLQLDRLVIRLPFVHWSAWSFRLMIVGIAGGILTLLFAFLQRRARRTA